MDKKKEGDESFVRHGGDDGQKEVGKRNSCPSWR